MAARGLGRDEAEAHVACDRRDVARPRIAEAAAARHRDDDPVAKRHGLLTLAAQPAAGRKMQLARRTVTAAVTAARRMIDAVVIGAERERRRIEGADLHNLAEPAAKTARSARVWTVFLLPDNDWRHRLVDLDWHVAHAARKRGGGEAILAGTRAGAAGMKAHYVEGDRPDGLGRILGAARAAGGEQVPQARGALGRNAARQR